MNEAKLDPVALNIVSTSIQSVGLAGVATIMLLMERKVRLPFFTKWAHGFAAFAFGILALALGFHRGGVWSTLAGGLYFFCGYVFLIHLLDGVHLLHNEPERRGIATYAGALVISALSSMTVSFSDAFLLHAIAFSAFLGIAAFRVARLTALRAAGAIVLVITLAALSIDYAQQAVMLVRIATGTRAPLLYSIFMPVVDLVADTGLAAGMTITGMAAVQSRLRTANRELAQAQERLEEIAKTDSLTELLNRHAFSRLLTEPSALGRTLEAGGVVALVDLNGLKILNDRYGHATGDAAIRAVAKSLRATFRPDDLIFRWGGDEFVVVVYGLSAADVSERLKEMQSKTQVLVGSGDPIDVTSSFGCASFETASRLLDAIGEADRRMYEQKQRRA